MADRELLEAAAKAAGIEVVCWNDGNEPYSSGPGFILPSNRIWNPLTDDGDEARLEAVLGLDVMWFARQVGVHGVTEDYADHGGDKQKARRWAGVHASAALAPQADATKGEA